MKRRALVTVSVLVAVLTLVIFVSCMNDGDTSVAETVTVAESTTAGAGSTEVHGEIPAGDTPTETAVQTDPEGFEGELVTEKASVTENEKTAATTPGVTKTNTDDKPASSEKPKEEETKQPTKPEPPETETYKPDDPVVSETETDAGEERSALPPGGIELPIIDLHG